MKKLLVLGVAIAAMVAKADTWYVAENGDDDNNTGKSSDSPFATLAKAYASAADTGDEIEVATGHYIVTATLTVAKGVTIRSASGNPEDVRIDGWYATKGWCRPFLLNNAGAKLLNICVENGRNTEIQISGANVYISSNGGTVEGCIIRGGYQNVYSGSSHGACGGGGIACVSANGLIVNCVITNNTTCTQDHSQGGGLHMTAGTAVGCFIGYNNSLENYEGRLSAHGGGVFLKGTAKLVNCTIVGNTCKNGAGVDAFADTVRVVNCVLWDNHGDGGYEDYSGYKDVFVNCLSRHKINDTCLETGSICADGTFLVPTIASLAINASEEVEGVTLPSTDILGNPRKVGSADLGCAERQAKTEGDLRLSASEGVLPASITFAAASEGFSGVTSYKWDFDGDGAIDETTAEPSVTHAFTTAQNTVTPTVTIVHADGSLLCTSAATLTIRPKTMYVNGASATPEVPYDTEEKAAKTIYDAITAAVDGQEIVVMSAGSPYQLTAATAPVVTKAVTIRGETGNPEDVVINVGGKCRGFRIACPQAFIHSLAIQNGTKGNTYGTGILIDTAGGTVSNCIVRSCRISGYWSSGVVLALGADAFVTHSVITNNTTSTDSEGALKASGIEVRSGAIAANCLIANNRDTTTKASYTCAGGAYANGGYLRSCTIVDNKGSYSGGIRVGTLIAGQVTDCVIAGNQSLNKGSDYNNVAPERLTAYLNCASDDGEPINENCICAPSAELFTNYALQDYTIGDNSVLIDAGVDHDSMGTLDLALAKRKMGKAIDVGAYEYDNETVRLTGNVKSDVTEGLCPLTVTFTATVGGTNGTETMSYEWDFGEGGETVTTTSPVCPHEYARGGNFTIRCRISVVDHPEMSVLVEKPNFVYFVGRKMYVTPNGNDNAAFPYDTVETAATSLNMALDVALDGVEIVMLAGTHRISENTIINKALTVHSETDAPENAAIADDRSGYNEEPLLSLNHPNVVLRNLTVENAHLSNSRAGCLVSSLGGTISNCVIRGFCNGTYHCINGALTLDGDGALATHCIITNNFQGGGQGGNGAKAIVRVLKGRLENSLIARNTIRNYTELDISTPLVRVGGVMVNCTVASNSVNALSLVLSDWNEIQYDKTYYGAITNCIFAGNTFLDTGDVPPMDFQSTLGCRNVTDAAETAVGWTSNVPADTLFDSESDVSPWDISLLAVMHHSGAKGIDISATDLGGRPRRTGIRLDPGCYQCQKKVGLMWLAK